MSVSIIIGAISLGLIFSILSFGVFISLKILNIPDLTIDGSFTLGSAVGVICVLNNHPILAVFAPMIAGAMAGVITGILQTKLKVQMILAGILTMTALYSINLHVMDDQPNLSIFGKDTIFTPFKEMFGKYNQLIVLSIIVIILIIILNWFLKTQLGMSLRCTGDNEAMVRASSINTDLMKIIGLALSNALVALSGAIFSFSQNFADVSSGIGMMVIGLASVIIGEALFHKKDSIIFMLISAVAGSIIYRFLLTVALQMGLPSSDLKLLSALLVTVAISLPVIKTMLMKRRMRHAKTIKR